MKENIRNFIETRKNIFINYICIFLVLLSLTIGIYVLFFTYKGYYDVKMLKQTIIDISKKQDYFYINKLGTNVQKEIENRIDSFYNNVTTNTIDRINCAIAILGAIATIFAVFGICISFLNINTSTELQKKADRIVELEKRISELKSMQYLVLGKLYELSDNKNRIRYAIQEYERANGLPNSRIISIQLIGIYSDFFEKTQDKNFLEIAFDHMQEEEKRERQGNDNKPILVDWYFTQGCLYGLIAKNNSNMYCKYSKKELLEKSKEKFKKAINIDKENYQLYTNLALTCHNLGDMSTSIDNFIKAKRCIDNDKYLRDIEIDVLEVFDWNDIYEMGYNVWRNYTEKVQGKVGNIQDFYKKINEKKTAS